MDQELNQEPAEEEHLTDPWYLPKFTHSIELADGTTLTGYAILNESDDDLWVTLDPGTSLTEAFTLFNNSENTCRMVSHISILSTIAYEGYTRLALIREDAGQVKILMKKPST